MGEESKEITVKIKPVTGNMFSITLDGDGGTIFSLKEEICKTYEAPGPESIRLIYRGVFFDWFQAMPTIILHVNVLQDKSSRTKRR